MISGLSSRYGVGGGKMELETELEEGEACFQDFNGDDSTIDPDISLSYIDEKLQDVLGYCQKDFEGGVSAENLGAKFGGYGSFLPTYQHSPVCPHPKTAPKVLTHNASVSLNNAHDEGQGGHQNSVSQSSASQVARHGPVSISSGSVPAPRKPSINRKLKQKVPISIGQQRVSNDSDQKSLKVRIKVGSDNISARRNAKIYSGLGLDVSPLSSLEASPVNSDGFFHVPWDGPDDSPTSILEIMTAFPLRENLLLSPLPYDILHLSEKEKWEDDSCGPVHNGSQESTVTALHRYDSGKGDRDVIGEKKPKSSEKNTVSMESTNGTEPSQSHPVLTQDDRWVEKLNVHDDSVGKILEAKINSEEKSSVFPTKADSDVSKRSKTLDTGLIKPPKQKSGEKATPCEKEDTKLAPGKETSSLGGKRKSKGGRVLENCYQKLDVLKGGLKNESSFASRTGHDAYGSKSYIEDLMKNNGKARDSYKDLFGEVDLELEDDDNIALEKPSGDRLKDSAVTQKLNAKKSQNSSSLYASEGTHKVPTIGNGSVSDAAVATVSPLVNEDWVCCDKCEKWRLLPPSVNPGCLPEKWLCSMLDWLPGMNRCSITEEETTKAITSRFPGPPIVRGSQPVHPGGPQLGMISVDALLPDQRHHLFDSQAQSTGVKKKCGSKDIPCETKQDKRECTQDYPREHKKVKTHARHGTDHGETVSKASYSSSNGLPAGISKDCWKHNDHSKDAKFTSKVSATNPENQNQVGSKDGTFHMGKCAKTSLAKKRKANEFENTQAYVEETNEIGHRKEKKARVPKVSKDIDGADNRGRNLKDEQLVSLDVLDSSKRGTVPVNASMAATSSSSKVSGSHKTKSNNQEAKGSPVESVSSSPVRIFNPHKFTSSRRDIRGVNDCQDASSPKKCSGEVNHETSGPLNKYVDVPPSEEKLEGVRNKSQGKPYIDYDKFENGFASKPLSESAKVYGQSKHRHHDGSDVRTDAISRQDVKQNLPMECDGEKSSKRGKSHSLPSSGRSQNETEHLTQPFSGSCKENARHTLSLGGNDALKALKQNKKAENQNVNRPMNMRNPTPNRLKGRDHGAPSPLRKDTPSQAAANALKEATNLKHTADRVKNSGSNLNSRVLYIQAALKFLHAASLLESCYIESGKYADMSQSMSIYSSTAKLCEYCAHEYERTREMAAAALAYKCMEVAYLRVIYSSHASARKDRHELQTSLQISPAGESPSSSASDLDNLNNPPTADKYALVKGVNSPQVAGNHVIAARNKPNFIRILNFTQDVNLAMEASRNSRIAFATSSSKQGAHSNEALSTVKTALDFNFQDVEELSRLVRAAMEVINM